MWKDPLTGQWRWVPILFWCGEEVFFAFFPWTLTLLIGFQRGWYSSMDSDMEPRVIGKIEQGVKMMRIDRESPVQPTKKKAHNTRTCSLPSWGQIKWLAAEKKKLLYHTLQP
jgi:hypothetical protein